MDKTGKWTRSEERALIKWTRCLEDGVSIVVIFVM